jgi:hypothetical protein
MIAGMSPPVKGFGCWPDEGWSRVLRGPASESLQGRKPRARIRGWCGALWGFGRGVHGGGWRVMCCGGLGDREATDE